MPHIRSHISYYLSALVFQDVNIVSAFSKPTDSTGYSIRHSITVEIDLGGYGKVGSANVLLIFTPVSLCLVPYRA